MLCEKVHSGRVKQLKEDQEYIQKGEEEWDESDDDGSDDGDAGGDEAVAADGVRLPFDAGCGGT